MKGNGIRVLLSVTVLIVSGTLGYAYIEGWTLQEAFYMTFITITTTGYQEVNPLTPEGRIFTVFLLTAGVATIAYISNVFIYDLVSMDRTVLRRKKMFKKISNLKDHTIVCGFGRMGKIICAELWNAGVEFVVIDKYPDNFKNVPEGYLWLEGDATSDDLLVSVGIDKAKALASMVDSDADSLYLTLAARSLNPGVDITARFSHDSAGLKLKRAGANQVIQPLKLSGKRVAQMIMGTEDDQVVVERRGVNITPKMKIEQMKIVENSRFINKTVIDFEAESGLLIAGRIDKAGQVLPRPTPKTKLRKNDEFIVFCKATVAAHLEKAA